MTGLRVLHVWDTAGVGCILSKYLNRLGVESKVVHRKNHDPFGFLDFYSQYSYDVGGRARIFLKEVVKRAGDADIIHVHWLDSWLPWLKLRFPRKTLILHYHGDDIRYKGASIRKRFYQLFADLVLVSTQDLLGHAGRKAVWLPNPVDLDHFKPMPELRRKEAFTFKMRYIDPQKIASDPLLQGVDMIDRELSPIPYRLMPQFLNQYQTYIDIKYEKTLLEEMSTTGLQALACGLKVLDYRKQYRTSFPEIHRGEAVAQRLLEIYQSLGKADRSGRLG